MNVVFYISANEATAARAGQIQAALEQAGCTCSGCTTKQQGEGAGVALLQDIGMERLQAIRAADIFVLLQSASNGSHAELGIAVAEDLPVIICSPTPIPPEGTDCPFYFTDRTCVVTGEWNRQVDAVLDIARFLQQRRLEFGDRIRKLRKEQVITQKELAMLAELPVGLVMKYESGRLAPATLAARRMAAVLGTTVEQLMQRRE